MSEPRPPRDDLDGLRCPRPEWFERLFEVPRQERDVEVEGSPVRTYVWGPPDRPGVVLVHGFMAHARCLAFIAALLSDRFRVVAYDLSGMGDSPMHPDFDPGLRGRELAAVAAAESLFEDGRRPFLVAHSQGGHSAMSAIEEAPDAYAGLVVCDMMMIRPSVARQVFAGRRDRAWPPGEVRPHKVHADLATILARYKLAPPQPCDNEYLLEYIARHSVRSVEGGFVWKFDPRIRVSDGFPGTWWAAQGERFARLALPRALVHGERSRAFGAEAAAYLRELSGGSVPIAAIPEAHHHLMLDQPIAFASVLRAILEGWLAERGEDATSEHAHRAGV